MVCYDYHDDTSDNAPKTSILHARPAILIDNTAHSLWGTLGGYGGSNKCIPSYYTPDGTEVFGYITGGYEGTTYGDTRDILADNLTRIDGIASDGATGVFLDEVTSYPDANDKIYLQSIYDRCASNGLKLILNTGYRDFDTAWLLPRCSYIMTEEVYDGSRTPSASESSGIGQVLTVSSGLTNATNAKTMTEAAFTNGFYYHYPSQVASYVLPTWLSSFVSITTWPESAVTPVANFSASVTSGAAPFTANFTDLSTNDPTSWAWDFKSSSAIYSTSANPIYIYYSAGIYTVRMTATNEAGSDTKTISGYIVVNEPAPVTIIPGYVSSLLF
jgi:hypothetical protein